jgi:hypothetical protein
MRHLNMETLLEQLYTEEICVDINLFTEINMLK